jgi:hypothetical protein
MAPAAETMDEAATPELTPIVEAVIAAAVTATAERIVTAA